MTIIAQDHELLDFTGISLIFDAPLTAYSVMESTGQLTVCVRAEGGVINSDFNIIFTVTQDSAKGKKLSS